MTLTVGAICAGYGGLELALSEMAAHAETHYDVLGTMTAADRRIMAQALLIEIRTIRYE